MAYWSAFPTAPLSSSQQAVGPGPVFFFRWRHDAEVIATWEMPRLPWLWPENGGYPKLMSIG